MTPLDNIPEVRREDICRLPGPQRVPYVEQIRVLYPRWNAIVQAIHECHTDRGDAAEPQCLLLVGPTGAGKTTLINSYIQSYPTTTTKTGLHCPVLRVTIPSPATIKNLATSMLNAFGDPRATSGTVGSMTIRIINFMKDTRVDVLFLDELQHFFDKENRKVMEAVNDWLKNLIKETGVSCVLVGLEGEAELVVAANPQLARLFGDPFRLSPFAWNEDIPTTIVEFRTFLDQLERMLPLNEPSHLANRDRAWRCYVACDGVVSYLMALVRRAARLALKQNREHIDDVLLAQAFSHRLAGERRGIANPFTGPLPVPAPKPLNTSPLGANRRSNRRGKRKSESSIL